MLNKTGLIKDVDRIIKNLELGNALNLEDLVSKVSDFCFGIPIYLKSALLPDGIFGFTFLSKNFEHYGIVYSNNLNDYQRELVILHELSHLLRGDVTRPVMDKLDEHFGIVCRSIDEGDDVIEWETEFLAKNLRRYLMPEAELAFYETWDKILGREK